MNDLTRNADSRAISDRAAGSLVVWLVLYALLMAAFMALQNAPSLMELR
jgi:hypothetical protein